MRINYLLSLMSFSRPLIHFQKRFLKTAIAGFGIQKNILQPLSSSASRGICIARNYSISGGVLGSLGLKMNHTKHSEKKVVEFPNLKITVLPATGDNFMYLIVDKESQEALVVDPVDPETILAEVKEQNVTLKGVLTTHHHWDHAGGNVQLVKLFEADNNNKLVIYGGDQRIGALTEKVEQGHKITLGSLDIECLFTPCHTTGHICYYLKSSDTETQKPAVFTGDTLFVAGCGRFFEGSAEDMYVALIDKLGQLPDDTLIFCGHEYTVNNLKFALSIEPDNGAMEQKIEWARNERFENNPTVPSTIGEEKQINPFMRCVVPEIQKKFKIEDPIKLMGKLREMKDRFKA